MKQNYQTFNRHKQKITWQAKFICCLIILAGLSGALNAQQTYTFNTAGGLGRYGPTTTQVTNTYVSTNLNGLVTSTNGVQSFTVSGGLYRITAVGAHGGKNPSYDGGFGTSMQGDFTLPANAVINILVGQHGEFLPSNIYNCGGGGGSFVWVNGQTLPLIAVGGGGGAGAGYTGMNSVLTPSGTTGNPSTQGAPGVNGNGANPGGAGWFTDGTAFVGPGTGCTVKCLGGTAGTTPGGASPTSCIAGIGLQGCSAMIDVGDGGFGGGSGGNGNCSSSYGAGGGGGYSGGVGQADGTINQSGGLGVGGGGGGSYNGGINQVNAISTRTGDGIIIIQELCNISLTASGSNSLNPSICSGQSLSLTTNGISNYVWSTGNTTNSVIVVSPVATTVYTLSATSPSNCTAVKSITVIVSPGLPVLTITNTPNSICLGKTATLTAGGAVTYTWAGGPGGVINGQTFTPTATSNYTVTGQNGCGTTTSVTTITVAPLAVTAASSPTLVCSGSTATLTASSAVTGYTWFPVAVPGISVVVAPTVNTVYTVVASDGTCAGVATVTLNTKPNPTLSIAASNQTVCEGAVVTMTASGALSYTWTSPASNAPNISANPTAPTLYQVSGMNSVNCVASANQIIFTEPTPTIAITSNKTIVCSGDPVSLTASGATTYNWIGGPATAGNQVNPTSNTTYTASGTTGNCTGTQTITINVLTASVAASVSTPSVCNGESTNLHASGANTYVWVGLTSFNGNVTVSPSVTTVYIVNATTTASGLNCPSSNNITVTVFNNPTVTIAATKTVVCKSDPNIVLTAGGATTYTWSTSTVTTNISVHPQSTTTYSITGVNANGCMNTASQIIQVNSCNGIAELTDKKNNISIYPNPSNGEFVVSSDSDINLKLINELGQEIRTMSLTDQNDHKVSVTNLANGVYFIVGQNNADKVNQKIIVTK